MKKFSALLGPVLSFVVGCTPAQMTSQNTAKAQNWWTEASELESWTVSVRPETVLKTSGFYSFSQLRLDPKSNEFLGNPLVIFKESTGDLAIRYDKKGVVDGVKWSSPDLNLSWNRGSQIKTDKAFISMQDGAFGSRGLATNPNYLRWYYQSNSLWLQPNRVTQSLKLGVASFGRKTKPDNIPAVGSRTYDARFLGFLFDRSRGYKLALADGQFTVNFEKKQWDARLTSVAVIDTENNKAIPTSFTYSGIFPSGENGETIFNPEHSEQQGPSIKIQLYGPYGMEVGGIFHSKTENGQSFIGAFGGR